MNKKLLIEKFQEVALIEQSMKDVYSQCLQVTEDEHKKKIFQKLIEDETRHAQIEQTIIELISQ